MIIVMSTVIEPWSYAVN